MMECLVKGSEVTFMKHLQCASYYLGQAYRLYEISFSTDTNPMKQDFLPHFIEKKIGQGNIKSTFILQFSQKGRGQEVVVKEYFLQLYYPRLNNLESSECGPMRF